MSTKNPLTPAGVEPATFQFVAQHINHCATAVPLTLCKGSKRREVTVFSRIYEQYLNLPEASNEYQIRQQTSRIAAITSAVTM